VIDPQFWAGWPWEFEAISNRLVGQHNFNRVAKTIFRMAAIWGLESLASNWRSPKCLMFVMPPKPLQMILRRSGQMDNVDLHVCALDGFCIYSKLCMEEVQCGFELVLEPACRWIFIHCRTVAKDCMFWKGNLKSWVTKEPRPVMRSAWPMTVSGIHYALVEGGGFMSCLGFSHDQSVHLTTLERVNMVAHHTMGTPNDMDLVRQRVGTVGCWHERWEPRKWRTWTWQEMLVALRREWRLCL
jgi:hypothetical protein